MNDYVMVTYQANNPERWLGEEVMVTMSYEEDELSDPEIISFPARVSEETLFPESNVLTIYVYDDEALNQFSEEEIEEAVREAISVLDSGQVEGGDESAPLSTSMVRAGAMIGGGLH